MCLLEYFLYLRVQALWEKLHLSSVGFTFFFGLSTCLLAQEHGPTPGQMVLLFLVIIANSITLLALSVMFAQTLYLLGGNITSIESLEIERHENLLRRSKKNGGYLEGPDGSKFRMTKQEFPYDIGILRNIQQALGNNMILWLWPFAASPRNESGFSFETNGFEGMLPFTRRFRRTQELSQMRCLPGLPLILARYRDCLVYQTRVHLSHSEMIL